VIVDLKGKRAAVTGGGRGIGAAIARALSSGGAEVTLLGRNREVLEKAAAHLQESGLLARALQCDVSDESSVNTAFQQIGPVDILVNNAGQAHAAPFERTRIEDWERVLRVNATGAFLCTHAALPSMLERRSGRIVNIASTAGLKGYTRMSAYVASKHALIGLTRSLALETAKSGVTVNAVCPSYTESDMTAEGIKSVSARLNINVDEARKMLVRQIPQGEMIKPEQVATAVIWLCSPEAASVTGIALPIAGGEVM
jgi:NAD(P)-dependent dehydrogenase (short-subunit alcohol dehydrogenase family)